jgi:hypothetical protein
MRKIDDFFKSPIHNHKAKALNFSEKPLKTGANPNIFDLPINTIGNLLGCINSP